MAGFDSSPLRPTFRICKVLCSNPLEWAGDVYRWVCSLAHISAIEIHRPP